MQWKCFKSTGIPPLFSGKVKIWKIINFSKLSLFDDLFCQGSMLPHVIPNVTVGRFAEPRNLDRTLALVD